MKDTKSLKYTFKPPPSTAMPLKGRQLFCLFSKYFKSLINFSAPTIWTINGWHQLSAFCAIKSWGEWRLGVSKQKWQVYSYFQWLAYAFDLNDSLVIFNFSLLEIYFAFFWKAHHIFRTTSSLTVRMCYSELLHDHYFLVFIHNWLHIP